MIYLTNMRTIKIGDKFRLGEWEWEWIVTQIEKSAFKAEAKGGYAWIRYEYADEIAWLDPPLTISKRLKEEIKKKAQDLIFNEAPDDDHYADSPKITFDDYTRWLDSLEETE